MPTKNLPPRNLNLDPAKARAAHSTTPRRFPRKTMVYRGVKLRLYSLAWLSSLCGKSQRAFHKWEGEGIFPRPIFDLKDGYRWYTAAEITGYRRIVQSAGLRPGRYADGEKRTIWLKTHSFTFKSNLQNVFKTQLGAVPTSLANEDQIMSAFAPNKKLKLTEADVLRLIKN